MNPHVDDEYLSEKQQLQYQICKMRKALLRHYAGRRIMKNIKILFYPKTLL